MTRWLGMAPRDFKRDAPNVQEAMIALPDPVGSTSDLFDALARACEDCGAEAGEPCRVDCLGPVS